MENMEQLVSSLRSQGVLKNSRAVYAFSYVDRKDFVTEEYKDGAYEDNPLPIGYGQTISQPYTVAFMFDLLDLNLGEKVLDVGSGSGWTTALASVAVDSNKEGKVFAVERIPSLVEFSKENISKYKFKNTFISKADDNKLGYISQSPFDKILVSASAEELPMELVEQLKVGGVMVIPVVDSICRVERVAKNEYDIKKFYGFTFVPLL